MGYVFFVPAQAKDAIYLSRVAEELEVNPKTVRRWAKHGLGGIKLKVCHLPQGLATTWEQYDIFVQEINDDRQGQSP